MTSISRFFGACFLPVVLTACGASTSSLTTSSLFGGKSDDVAAAAAVETPGMRAAQVAAVSARAAKCGYNFDAAKLKSSFLSAEISQGAGAQDMGKIEREYDTIRSKVAATIAADPDFCTERKTREIKVDLTRHLAGDFSAPASKKIDEKLLASGPRARETLNPDFVNDPWASKTKKVAD